MKRLVLTVALCFTFAAVGHAGGCSDLCNECKKTKLSSVCCSAHIACAGNCKAASKDDCPKSDWNTEDDNRHRQPVFAPDFERDVR
jgi:hypothetical protein